MKKITIIRTVTTLGVASALALAAPLAASAHVRVTPDQAAAGSYAVLTFRVPTESATASTVKLEVDFPTTTPFSTVSYQPITGWQAVVTTVKLATPVKTATATITEAVTKVVWTADAASAIAPGQFQQFSVSAGPVPDTGSVMLPAQQTYSDGTVVNWDQPTPASGTEPQHPAPTLYINDAPPSASGPATVPTVSATPSADPAGGASGSSASNDAQSAGVWVGLGGLALGAIALVVAVLALTRQGRVAQRAAGASERGGTSPRNDTSGKA